MLSGSSEPARPSTADACSCTSGRRRGGQPEEREESRIEERHDLLDLTPTQGEDTDAVGRECAGLLAPLVRRKRRLAVCGHRHHLPAPGTVQRVPAQEGGDVLAT